MFRFTADFDDGVAIARVSAERTYTHAWLVRIGADGQTAPIHGFSSSREHAEAKIAQQRKTFSRPSSRVRVVHSEIAKAARDELGPAPPRRLDPWG